MLKSFGQLGHGGYTASLADGEPAMAVHGLSRVLDFSANLNPQGPPEWLRPTVSEHLHDLLSYPDPDCTELGQAISRRFDVPAEEVLFGNGSSELLYALPRVLEKKGALIPTPAYVDYERACALAGLAVEHLELRPEDGFRLSTRSLSGRVRPDQVVIIGQPSNPTGALCEREQLLSLAHAHPRTFFVLDEAFIDFVGEGHSLRASRPDNVVVLYSMTKSFAIAGLRLGCLFGRRSLIDRVRSVLPPWSVNALAQAVGKRAIEDVDYLEHSRRQLASLRATLMGGLRGVEGLIPFESAANYILVRLDRPGWTAIRLAAELAERGIVIRVCDNYRALDARYFRVAVWTEIENNQFLIALRAVLDGSRHKTTFRGPKKKPAIMFQGTSSNAGKSVLTAALCRILLQDGVAVAPFKAQNMSLNSFVTDRGEEMGRAQVVQASACKLKPDVRMNPILLKPCSDTGSQIIVNGKPIGEMGFDHYGGRRSELLSHVRRAYDTLSAEADVMVIEGAGSPAEINLRSRDIVNMEMARYADAKVVLVGDIDRGGVFASFMGTLELLLEWERALMKGFVINRFRGDPALLGDAIEYLASTTRRPVLGTVPFISDLGLPEEDSVTFKAGELDARDRKSGAVEVAVIDLPHISNFNDIDPFRMETDVALSIVRSPEELVSPDVIILPGSKNVLGDLEYLMQSGLAAKIVAAAKTDRVSVVGICAGYQILGTSIADPHGIETRVGHELAGLGLLPHRTVLAEDKTLRQCRANHIASGLEVEGYEIHHGCTASSSDSAAPAVFVGDDGLPLGTGTESGLVFGTYLHGVFDRDRFRRWFIDTVRTRKGIEPRGHGGAVFSIEPALDRLAERVRASLDMTVIYEWLGI